MIIRFLVQLGRGGIEGSPLFHLEKRPFHAYFSSKAEIWLVHLVQGLDVPFGSLNFLVSLQPLSPFSPLLPKYSFIRRFFLFFMFVMRRTSLQIELGC